MRLPSTDDVGHLDDEVDLHDRQHDEQQAEHQQHCNRLPVEALPAGRLMMSAAFRAEPLDWSRARRASHAAPTSAIQSMAASIGRA